MTSWYSIEVLDGASSSSVWAEAYRDSLMEAAVTSGASDWAWHRHTWGVVFEVCFADEDAWDRYVGLSIVKAALDAVPDPLTGLIVYQGRGGSSGSRLPRHPRPMVGSGSAALPLPYLLSLEEEMVLVAPLVRPALAVAG